MAQDAADSDRLREFLRQLSPDARAKLLSAFERAPHGGADGAIAGLVLRELKAVVSPPVASAAMTQEPSGAVTDPAGTALRCLEPFLVDRHKGPVCPGQIDRASLPIIWHFVTGELLRQESAAFESDLAEAERADSFRKADSLCRQFQGRFADAIGQAMSGAADATVRKHLARLGPEVTADLAAVRAALKNRETLEALQSRLPTFVKDLNVDQAAAFLRALDVPSLQSPQVLPLALTLVLRRLQTPQHLVRLAIAAAESDDSAKVAATPYAAAVSIVLGDMAADVARLRADMRQGSGRDMRARLKRIHDGVRGVRTELDIPASSPWGRQLSAIRADISGFLNSELESALGRVRRLLRAPREGAPAPLLDSIEIDETAQLIELVIICRDFASELALNEVSLRTYSDLRQYLETASEALIERLRVARAQDGELARAQFAAALRFCQIMFGQDYVATLGKAAGVAMQAERKPKKA